MTPDTQPAPTKVCIRCGVDCAGKPRTKDAAGNYVCGSCVAALRAARAAAPPAEAPPPLEPENPPAPTAAPEPVVDGDDARVFPLADDAPIPLDADPIDLSEPITPPRTCGGCGLLMAAGAVVCTACGFDVRTNSVHAGPAGRGPTCFNCGYSLVGLKGKTCPECGSATRGRERMLALERKNAADSTREVYLKPIIMFGAGVALSSVVLLLGSGGLSKGVVEVARMLVGYAISVPFGVLTFLACCLVWIGFNAPVHLIALRLAAVYAVADAVGVICSFIPLPIIPWLVWVVTYVGLLQDMLELDLIDAYVVALITFIAKMVVLMTIVAYMKGYLNL